MVNIYSKFYSFYNYTPIIISRIFLFVVLIFFSSISLFLEISPNLFIFILSWLLIIEIFYHFKVLRVVPGRTVNDASSPLEVLTLESYYSLDDNPERFLNRLLKFKNVKFLLEKGELSSSDLKIVDFEQNKLLAGSLEIVRSLNGKYITTADLLVSYLLLTEERTKLLFDKELKEDEMLEILSWTRTVYKEEEIKTPIRVNFNQEGLGEIIQSGWTYETQKYMQEVNVSDFKKASQIIGREEEYKEINEALYQKKGVLLVGEVGSGRSAMLDKLYLDSFSGNSKGAYHKRFFEVLLDTILAGAGNPGEISLRLNSIVEEVAHSGNVILVVKNFENILGASAFKINLLDIIVPYIKSNRIQMIGLITPASYKKYVEPAKELLVLFQGVFFPQLSEKTILQILFSKTDFIEKKYKIKITYKALKACVKYADEYMPHVQSPGASVSLLGDSVATLSKGSVLREEDVIKKVESRSHIPISTPSDSEKQLLLKMESEIHKRVVSQDEAVSAVSEALRRIRTTAAERNKPISFLFLGPTGVGKTEVAKSLARVYFGSEEKMIRLDMSEYSGDDSLDRLLGKGEKRGELSEKVFENPFSLILLDEFEKASPTVLNLFLQILDDGRLTDSFGKTVSFVNTFIIATSNAGSEFIREEVVHNSNVDKIFKNKLLERLQTKGVFSPELLNRFDEIVVFKPLDRIAIKEIAKLLLGDLEKRMQEKEVDIIFDDSILNKIVNEGFDEQFGARPIRRYIQDNIEDLLAREMLADRIKRGNKIKLLTNEVGNIVISNP